MKTSWTDWAKKRVLPLPGEAWTVAVDVNKAAARLAKAGGGEVPASPNVATEVGRAGQLRLHERYNVEGNTPKDTVADDLVDLWVARKGVAFALEVAIAMTEIPRHKEHHEERFLKWYEIRHDGRPWGRLREHLAATPAERDGVVALATEAYGKIAWKDGHGVSELPFALAFLTCNQDWIDALADKCDDAPRYGRQCILAAISAPERASRLRVCAEQRMSFQITEDAYEFIPTLMKVLPDADAAKLLEIAERIKTKAIRRPWLEIIGSLTTPAAKAYVARHTAPAAAKVVKKAAKPAKTKR